MIKKQYGEKEEEEEDGRRRRWWRCGERKRKKKTPEKNWRYWNHSAWNFRPGLRDILTRVCQWGARRYKKGWTNCKEPLMQETAGQPAVTLLMAHSQANCLCSHCVSSEHSHPASSHALQLLLTVGLSQTWFCASSWHVALSGKLQFLGSFS